ncbi:pyridoxal phosphate-dependent transferase [Fusarium oxysporum f. sp. albedinis]|nr:pyridoxal phosphate-dependent transferase [Fusarium oxysporum f. sp. albedinis]
MSETNAGRNWVYPNSLRALPLHEAHIHPPGTPHAVSSSLPTWESVVALASADKRVLDRIEYSYPRYVAYLCGLATRSLVLTLSKRFFIGKPIRSLVERVRERLKFDSDDLVCYIFPSADDADDYAAQLRKKNAVVHHVRFFSPVAANSSNGNDYLAFSALFVPPDFKVYVMEFWVNFGTGITTRHAEYCLKHFDELISDSPDVEPVTADIPSHDRSSEAWIQHGPRDFEDLQAHIAQLATSERDDLKPVQATDVFIFPNGMNAIYNAAEVIAVNNPDSFVVAFGWIYPETIENLRRGTWKGVIPFKLGNEEELDQLASTLKTNEQIIAIFCELPSNIKFTSPNLHRIRELANEYGLIVVCDETVANFVNVDLLPYVDIITTSLTKMFSGAANVTGGRPRYSVIVNPNFGHYEELHYALRCRYPVVTCFPKDIAVLKQNSINMVERVKKANENTLIVIDRFENHPSVAYVNYPSRPATIQNYERHRRKNGGYGNVFSVVFHNPESAQYFYDNLDVCKGPSFGTNFTLAIPFVQLAVYNVQEKLEKYDLPKHVIRISVGLENSRQICSKMEEALAKVVRFEQSLGSQA